jgi:hypothetical protein
LEDGEVVAESRRYAGSLDLDDDIGSVEQLGGVDLRDRSRGERLGLEVAEQRVGVVPELGGDDLDDVRGRHGWDLVEAGAELVGEDLGEQAGARGDELGQLDVGRSELFEGAA